MGTYMNLFDVPMGHIAKHAAPVDTYAPVGISKSDIVDK